MRLNKEIHGAVRWDIPTVTPEENIQNIVEKMADNKVSALVVKSEDEVVGLITDMDLMEYIETKGNNDHARASDFMTACAMTAGEEEFTSPCIQLDSEESVGNALKVMNAGGTHHLLISGDGKSTGVVSIVDLMKHAIS